ncbi:MAG: hypothetical protein EU536_03545 [Promethearchaeota archaeon]|nr:MAG: hypothetical protein EU536_03545 [Candidatus Lokiarchaeota archaeon]
MSKEKDMTEEEYAVFMEVVNSGEKGIIPEDIAKNLKMSLKKVEEILDDFEERGIFYSEEE